MEKATMSVHELSMQMGISLPKAYELVKSPDFPSIHIGTRILVPVDAFREWLMTATHQTGSASRAGARMATRQTGSAARSGTMAASCTMPQRGDVKT